MSKRVECSSSVKQMVDCPSFPTCTGELGLRRDNTILRPRQGFTTLSFSGSKGARMTCFCLSPAAKATVPDWMILHPSAGSNEQIGPSTW